MLTGAAATETAYYQTVEDFFVSRRGDPLFLSNADWTLVHHWRTAGIPLRVVLRGIGDALDGHAHSWGRNHRVGSLRYCAAQVETARERWVRALALGAEEGVRVSDAMEGMALALEGGRGLGPEGLTLARRLAQDIRGRATGGARLGQIEPWLEQSEAALLAVLRQEAGPGVVGPLEAEVEATLRPYRDRMPARVLAQVREEGLARRLLARHGLPRLSLALL